MFARSDVTRVGGTGSIPAAEDFPGSGLEVVFILWTVHETVNARQS